MAEQLLHAWNARPVVSAVTIDAAEGKVAQSEFATVTDLHFGGPLVWTETEESLPLPFAQMIAADHEGTVALAIRSSNVTETLNQEPLRVTGLKSGRYKLTIDGEVAGAWSDVDLARGVNLAVLSTPMSNQAMGVRDLTARHIEIHQFRWRVLQVPLGDSGIQNLDNTMKNLDSVEAEVVARQRAAAQPRPHVYQVIRSHEVSASPVKTQVPQLDGPMGERTLLSLQRSHCSPLRVRSRVDQRVAGSDDPALDNRSPVERIVELNKRAIASGDQILRLCEPSEFALDGDWLKFTSPVRTPYPENDLVHARWFPSRGSNRKAVVVLPHWNAKLPQHNALCAGLQRLGISALRLSLPYHDARMPAGLGRADFAVSSNICRTIDATRQAVIDTRCCFDWLEQQGFTDLGIVGTSLGSCYAFLASSHDPRIRVNVFNHCSTYFADPVWEGSPAAIFEKVWKEKSTSKRCARCGSASVRQLLGTVHSHEESFQVIYTRFDTTFPSIYRGKSFAAPASTTGSTTSKCSPAGITQWVNPF